MRVMIVDDHELIRTGLSDTLRLAYPGVEIFEAENSASALALLERNQVDLAVVDLYIPGEESFSFLRKLCDRFPALTVVVLSSTENPASIRKCIDIGASGFIPKSLNRQQLLAALEEIQAGKTWLPDTITHIMPAAISAGGAIAPGVSLEQVIGGLTPRQREILQMLSRGESNKQIARNCGLSENTIKVHVSAILRALGLSNRTQAGVLMQQLSDAEPNP